MSPARQRPGTSLPTKGRTLPKAERFAGIKSAIEGLKPLADAAIEFPRAVRSNNIRMMPVHLGHVLNDLLTGARLHERGNHLLAHGYVMNALGTMSRCMHKGGQGNDITERSAREELITILGIIGDRVLKNLPNNEGKFGELKLAFEGLEEAARKTLVFIDILRHK